jgi:hypothetical protein
MLHIFEQKRRRAFIVDYSRYLEEQRTLSFVGKTVRAPKAIFFDTPDIENGWHGTPPTRMSWSGVDEESISRIFPTGISPKFAA